MERSKAGSVRDKQSSVDTSLQAPITFAARGYSAQSYGQVIEEAHREFHGYLSHTMKWQDFHVEEGIEMSVQRRMNSTQFPIIKGRGFIPNFRPIEILACILSIGYRIVWDTRLESARVVQRYSYMSYLFYIVFRGIGQLHKARDAIGIQDVRCWGPSGEPQTMAYPTTRRVDMVYKGVKTGEIPVQQDKVRMDIILGGFRIEWSPDLKGSFVTNVVNADVHGVVPTYIWNVMTRELPKVINRLRGAMEHFGVAPYMLDVQNCVVVQTVSYFAQERCSKFRHHVWKAGTYLVVLDCSRMYSQGIALPVVEGQGAHAVDIRVDDNQVLVSVGVEGIGQEYVIVSAYSGRQRR
ncbi:hypothetical protein CBS101457_003407 [Exobasidium rhododendri]|nr:hypothetical protein CBS101457_003407 [Exobasidium rhododendri]